MNVAVKKMIKVEPAESWRRCNCCYGETNVHNVIMRYRGTNGGTQVSLCGDCLAELSSEISKAVLNQVHGDSM